MLGQHRSRRGHTYRAAAARLTLPRTTTARSMSDDSAPASVAEEATTVVADVQEEAADFEPAEPEQSATTEPFAVQHIGNGINTEGITSAQVTGSSPYAADESSGGGGMAAGDRDAVKDGGEDAGVDVSENTEEADPVLAEPPAVSSVVQPSSTSGKKAITVEDLPPKVQARMDEVLHQVEDAGMREDARLINFFGEVEESQVCVSTCVREINV